MAPFTWNECFLLNETSLFSVSNPNSFCSTATENRQSKGSKGENSPQKAHTDKAQEI